MFDTRSEVIRTAWRHDKTREPEDTSFLDASAYKPDPDNYIDVIAPLPVFDAAFADHIVSVGFEVSNLVADILDAVFAGSVEAMMEWQGIPSGMRNLIASDSDKRGLLLGRMFCRPDLIVGPDGPRVLEVNFGPSNGSLALVDTVQTRFADTDQGNELTRRGIVLRPPASMTTLTQALGRVLRRCAAGTSHRHMLVAVATKEEAETPKGHIVDFCSGLSDVGFHVSLAQLSEICADDKKASLGGRRVDAIYCMGTFAEFQRVDVPHKLMLDLIELDRGAELDFIGGPAHLLFDNKANLALLHDSIADACFDASRLAHVRKHVAKTCMATHHSPKDGPVIYKPVNDFGGFGITFDHREVAAACNKYIAQEIIPNACQWVDETGNRTRHLCFGPSFAGGNHASTLLRAKSTNGAVPIINAAQGAAVGPVLVRERA